MAGTNAGRFAWYELMTKDAKAAIAFYTEVVGWKTQPFENRGYTMFVGSRGALGGTMGGHQGPPHWRSNVVVEDVDAAVALTKKRGGRVLEEPADMPPIGRFALIADPQGAVIRIFKPQAPLELHEDAKAGEFDWNELLTTDKKAAFDFYSALFGWKRIDEHDMGPMGTYLIYGLGGKPFGGMFTKTDDMKAMPTAWLYYVDVSDLDAAIGRVKSKGGKIANGPMEVPGGSRIAQCFDPQGAAFALHEPKK
jgi:predicted enzyme related to lactoylglutathione lyase